CVADSRFLQMPECKLCWRQNAEHNCAASNDLRPKHSAEIGRFGLERAERKTQREHEEAKRRQNSLVNTTHKKNSDRRHDQLCDASHQHDYADLERVMIPDVSKKDRHQIN